MFSNLLYFLIALIIYSTSELFKPVENFDNTLIFNSLLISVLFFIICNITFKRLEKKASQNPYENIDHLINNYISRLSILALMIFAVNIYGFKLSFLFTGIGVFDHFPTLEAIVFLGLLVYIFMSVQ